MQRRTTAVAVLACAAFGCAVHKPAQTYRLIQQETGAVLIPPGVAAPDLAQRSFRAGVVAGRGACRPGDGAVAIQVHKKQVRVTVTRASLMRQPPGWLGAWTAEIEEQGCLAPGEGLKLADRISEALPLEPNAAFHLLHTSHNQTGQVDLGARMRLQVASPILRDGDDRIQEQAETSGNNNSLTVTVKTTNVIGYETAWYAIEPKASGIGFAITPVSAERHIQGATERRAQPSTNSFPFSEDAAFYRLFYKADQTEFTALVIGARTRAELERRTQLLETGTASCEKLNDELCVEIPKRVAINPFLAVTVKSSEVMVHWGATVRDAIEAAGESKANIVPPQLAVYKLYGGRPARVEFDRDDPAILDLLLAGGEMISWK